MNRIAPTVILVASMFLGSGCATILTDDFHQMNVSTSNGEDTMVTIDGASKSAPGIVSVMKANQDKILVAENSNCTQETFLKKTIEPTFFINIIAGGVFGSSTDYYTGKMWKYQDSVVISCN